MSRPIPWDCRAACTVGGSHAPDCPNRPTSTYPHDDDKCRQDSVDAAIGREAIRQFARLATALGLRDENTSMDEVVDHLIARDVHVTYVPGAIRCTDLLAMEVPEPHESRTGTVQCDRCAGHLGPHRIGDVTWPNLTDERSR